MTLIFMVTTQKMTSNSGSRGEEYEQMNHNVMLIKLRRKHKTLKRRSITEIEALPWLKNCV